MANIYPVVYDQWALEGLKVKSTLISNGILDIDTAPPFTQGGKIFKVPYQNSSDNWGSPTEITGPTTTTTPEALSSFEVITGSIEKQYGHYIADYDLIRMNNISAISQLGGQVGQYWARYIDATAKLVLDAVYDSTGDLYSTNYYDNTALGNITTKTIVRACKLLGESGMMLDKIVVHSDVYAQLLIDMLVSQQPFQEIVNGIVVSGTFPSIFGKKIIVNDTICAATAGVYPCYLSGDKPIYLGYQKAMRVEDIRVPGTGGGQTQRYFTIDYGVAVKGVSYTGSASVTESLLGTAASWTKKFATENIRLVRIDTQIAE